MADYPADIDREPALCIRGLYKAFPGVQALTDINLEVYPGEIRALAGQNGAGKSTLIHILSGAEQPDRGILEVSGKRVRFHNPQDSQRAGIFTLYQELSLVPSLSVAENVLLNALPRGRARAVSWRAMRAQAREALSRLGFDTRFDVDQPVHSLTIAQQQAVELAKALRVANTIHGRAPVILLDEPTAAIPDQDVHRLFQALRELQAQGVTFIYISHHVDEIFEICQRVTVLRDGYDMGTREVGRTTVQELLRDMIGREPAQSTIGEAITAAEKPRLGAEGEPGEVVCTVKNLSDDSSLTNISFQLHRGEVVGVAGLVGSGQPELAGCLFGARKRTGGTIEIHGRPIKLRNPGEAIQAGIGLLPQDRKTQGLVPSMSVSDNITLANLTAFSRYSVIHRSREREISQRLSKDLDIRMSGINQRVRTLSGGNQQKVVLTKWLASKTDILIFVEPTRGIDIGAKEEIYRLIREYAERGGTALLMSSELAEPMMCDRILVMSRGRIVRELKHDEVDSRGEVITAQMQ